MLSAPVIISAVTAYTHLLIVSTVLKWFALCPYHAELYSKRTMFLHLLAIYYTFQCRYLYFHALAIIIRFTLHCVFF